MAQGSPAQAAAFSRSVQRETSAWISWLPGAL